MDRLQNTVTALEREYAKPVLATFRGVARYDASTSFLDATLVRRLQMQPSDAERRNIIHRYLDRGHEEYVMAKGDLAGTPATRAEVVALGLALREIALTLDEEVIAFRERSELLFDEQRTSVERLVDETRSSIARLEHDLHSSIEMSFKRHARNVSEGLAISERNQIARLTSLSTEQGNRLSKQLDEGLAASARRINDVSKECQRSIDKQRQSLEATVQAQNRRMSTAIAAIEAALNESETRLRTGIESLAREQRTAFGAFTKRLTIDRWLIATTLVIAVVALFR